MTWLFDFIVLNWHLLLPEVLFLGLCWLFRRDFFIEVWILIAYYYVSVVLVLVFPGWAPSLQRGLYVGGGCCLGLSLLRLWRAWRASARS